MFCSSDQIILVIAQLLDLMFISFRQIELELIIVFHQKAENVKGTSNVFSYVLKQRVRKSIYETTKLLRISFVFKPC